MKYYSLILLLFFLLTGCGGPYHYVSGSGTSIASPTKAIQYFRTSYPQRADLVNDRACSNSEKNIYLDFKSIKKDFLFTATDSLKLQYYFNSILFEESKTGHKVQIEDQSNLFFSALSKVEGLNFENYVPKLDTVNLVYIDNYITSKNGHEELKKFLNSKIFDLSPPVFLSFCYSSSEVQSFIEQNNLSFTKIYSIGTDFLTVYSENLEETSGMKLNLNLIFPSSKEISIFYHLIKKTNLNDLIDGKYNLRKISL